MNPVPLQDRRDYVPYFRQREREMRTDAVVLGVTAFLVLLALYCVGYALHVAPLPVVLPANPTTTQVCEYAKARPVNFTNLPSLDALREECAGVGVAI